jgi:hypothetical protein
MARRRLPRMEHYTDKEFLALCEKYDWRCLCCGERGKPLEPDHVIPRSRGGLDNIYNIQPLCHDCNLHKGTQAIDYRVQWPQTREKSTTPPNHDDFDYGLITNPDDRLMVYQRTAAIRRLLSAIGRDWDQVHTKVAEIHALGLPEEVVDAWHKHEIWPAVLGMREKSRM